MLYLDSLAPDGSALGLLVWLRTVPRARLELREQRQLSEFGHVEHLKPRKCGKVRMVYPV